MRPISFVIALFALAPAAGAQGALLPGRAGDDALRAVAPRADRPVWVEGFVSRQRALGGRAEGLGGRVLWALAPDAAEPADGGPLAAAARRLSVGAFAVRTAPRGRLAAWHFGAQADGRLLARPLAGRLEPIASLGVGAYRESAPARQTAEVPVVVFERPRATGRVRGIRPPSSAAHAALAPGLALRLRLARGVALRADARRLMVLDGGAREGLEVGAGVSVGR